MASATIQITVSLPRLEQLRAKLRDMSQPLAAIGNALKEEARLRFVEQASPYGPAWKPLSPATLANPRRGRNAQILRDTGRLMNSITYESNASSATVGTNVIYAAIHQFGGKAGRGRKVTIPARPYLPTNGLPPDQMAEVVTVLERYLNG